MGNIESKGDDSGKVKTLKTMKAELRIGNNVYYTLSTTDGNKHYIGRISCIHMNTVEIEGTGTWQFSQINPIPINDESLERLGFEQYNEAFWRYKKSEGWFLTSDGEVTKSLSDFYVRCDSVHSLQNLIYALTGMELTLKP